MPGEPDEAGRAALGGGQPVAKLGAMHVEQGFSYSPMPIMVGTLSAETCVTAEASACAAGSGP